MADDATNPAHQTDLASISDFVAHLATHMRVNGLASLDVEIPEARIRLRSERKADHAAARRHEPVVFVPQIAETIDETTPDSTDDDHYIAAPMIGTFYASPGPGEPPFVEVGDHVEVGQTIAIIEAMKIMNEIASDQTGTIAEILVQNADAVEYGQPLFRLTSGEE